MPVSALIFAFLATVTLEFRGALSVKITDLAVPSVVMNGSLPNLVLDCIYELDSPNNTASGLVVKWYHNRGHSPVYQWIPGYPPQAFGILRGYVNLNFVASEGILMRHRAIQLLQPRPELSGEFTCKVTTWSGVASATRRMTIYAPVKYMTLVSTKASEHRMTLTCKASGAYPEPEVTVFVQGSKEHRDELRGLQVTKALVDGAYSIRASRELDDREIPAQCLIYCRLSLPYTTYTAEEKIPHIRGRSHRSQSSSALQHYLSGWLQAVFLLRLLPRLLV